MIITMKSNTVLMVFLIALALAMVFVALFEPLPTQAMTVPTMAFSKPVPTQSEYAREETLRANATTTYMTADAYRAQFAPTTTTATTTIATLTAEIAWLEALLKSLSK